MYDRLKETLNDYEVIIRRWPEYTFVLENVCTKICIQIIRYSASLFLLCIELTFVSTINFEKAVADIEKAIVDALEKQYADVLSPLKENLAPKKFGLKYMQKLTKRSVCPYVVPDEVEFNFVINLFNHLTHFRLKITSLSPARCPFKLDEENA